LVFITKYHRKVLSALAIEHLAAIFAKVCGDFGAQLKAHADLLVIFAISTLVSSRLLRERRPETSGRCKDGALCSPSAFAGPRADAALSRIAEDNRNQREAAPPPRPEGPGIGREN
jgi:putative transposase